MMLQIYLNFISHILFAIGMEYLSRCMKHLGQNSKYDFPPKCKRLGITRLLFADDILMSLSDTQSIQLMFQAFFNLSRASGLNANREKSNIIIGGVFGENKASLLETVHVPEGSFPFGVHLSTKELGL